MTETVKEEMSRITEKDYDNRILEFTKKVEKFEATKLENLSVNQLRYNLIREVDEGDFQDFIITIPVYTGEKCMDTYTVSYSLSDEASTFMLYNFLHMLDGRHLCDVEYTPPPKGKKRFVEFKGEKITVREGEKFKVTVKRQKNWDSDGYKKIAGPNAVVYDNKLPKEIKDELKGK